MLLLPNVAFTAGPANSARTIAPTPTPTTLHPYHVTCAGLQYIAMATSAGMAIMDAMELHGVHAASARRVHL